MTETVTSGHSCVFIQQGEPLMKKIFTLTASVISLMLFTGLTSFAQSNEPQSVSENQRQSENQKKVVEQDNSIPNGYGNVTLGMSVEETKDTLSHNPQFGYRGDRDVAMLPGANRIIIETDTSKTAPYSFLKQCYFQFHEDRLYIITLNINPSKMDYYSMFSTLCKNYGNPTTMNPKKAEWVSDTVMLTLEKPLTLKYTDKVVFDRIQEESSVRDSAEEMSREMFLDSL